MLFRHTIKLGIHTTIPLPTGVKTLHNLSGENRNGNKNPGSTSTAE